jgi:hypothetical protein
MKLIDIKNRELKWIEMFKRSNYKVCIDMKNEERIRHQVRNKVIDEVNNKLWAFVWVQVRETMRKQFDKQLTNSLREEVSKKVQSAVWLRIHEQVVNKLFDKFHMERVNV